MPDSVSDLLLRLSGSNRIAAWREFLETYGPILQQVVGLFESERDPAADCFLFICEQLARDDFRRLLRFRPEGPASFATWLRAVARNLCIDWRRKTLGRSRDRTLTRAAFEPLADLDDSSGRQIQDPHPNPEAQAAERERDDALKSLIARLSGQEQLLLRLRFEQELTLDQIARLTGLKDAQTADRRLRQILDSLRQSSVLLAGKFRPRSV